MAFNPSPSPVFLLCTNNIQYERRKLRYCFVIYSLLTTLAIWNLTITWETNEGKRNCWIITIALRFFTAYIPGVYFNMCVKGARGGGNVVKFRSYPSKSPRQLWLCKMHEASNYEDYNVEFFFFYVHKLNATSFRSFHKSFLFSFSVFFKISIYSSLFINTLESRRERHKNTPYCCQFRGSYRELMDLAGFVEEHLTRIDMCQRVKKRTCF